MKLHNETFIGAMFDNDMDMSTFFVDNPDQKTCCFRTYYEEYIPTPARIAFEQFLD